MFLEIIKMSLDSMMAKKTRTFLSMLGIIIGVTTVIAVFAVGKGAQNSVDEQFKNMSVNSIIVMPTRGKGFTSSSNLKVSDADLIAEKAENINVATGALNGNLSVSYDSTESTYSVIGIDEEFVAISNLNISSGSEITLNDIDSKSMVALIGATIAEELFIDEDPIGKKITVGSKKIEVIGVLEKLGSRIGMMSIDDSVLVPYSTAEKSLLGDKGQVMITALINDIDNPGLATSTITSVLRDEHSLRIDQEDDFTILDAGSMVAAAQESSKTMSALLTAIAAITLLVSGIGIMNVMFVTVAERTKEIGIAKAIGGRQSDILLQFLLESMILSIVGGIIGIIIGQLAIPIISYFNLIAVSPSINGPILGFSFAIVVGVFFGFYPAYQASRLDPVDSLRSE